MAKFPYAMICNVPTVDLLWKRDSCEMEDGSEGHLIGKMRTTSAKGACYRVVVGRVAK